VGVWITVQDYKSLCVVVVISATDVTTQTHTAFDQLHTVTVTVFCNGYHAKL